MQVQTAPRQDAPIHQRRAHKRFDYVAQCHVEREDSIIEGVARNISGGGINMRLEGTTSIETGKSVMLVIDGFAPISAVVRWSEDRFYGFQFLTSLGSHPELAEVIAALEAGRSDA